MALLSYAGALPLTIINLKKRLKMEKQIEKKQISIVVKDLLNAVDTMTLPAPLVAHLMVAAGGIAVKSLNPSVADSLEMDLYHAVKDISTGDDAGQFMQLLAKMVVALKPDIAKAGIDITGEWTVTGELEGELLSLTLVPGAYKEAIRTEMRSTMVDFTTLGIITQAENVISILGGVDRERFNKLLISSHMHFTNNGRHNPLAVSRDILGNVYASLIAIKGDEAPQLTLQDVTVINSFVFDFIGLLSVEVQKISLAVSDEAQAIVESGGNVQITLKHECGEELKDDLFKIVIEETRFADDIKVNTAADTDTTEVNGEAIGENLHTGEGREVEGVEVDTEHELDQTDQERRSEDALAAEPTAEK